MKKYVIKNEDGSKQTVMPAIHDTRKEALLTILHYAIKVIESDKDDSRVEIPIDYMVKEVEEDGACECIPDFVSAISYLQARGLLHKEIHPCDFLGSLNPKHFEALDALNKLFTIAEAWNEEDGFVPDFSDWEQDKWFPWFKYDYNIKRFVCSNLDDTPIRAASVISSLLCFKTLERAAQFGKQFADLYNKVFL